MIAYRLSIELMGQSVNSSFDTYLKMLRRTLKWLGYGLATFIILVTILLLFFDWNWLRHPIEKVVTDKTGRALLIKGNINVHLGWPLVQVEMNDVTFANPAWATQPLMFTLKRLDGSLSVWQLLKHQIWMPVIRLEQPRIFFEQNPDGRKNWLLDRNQQDENAQVKIGHLLLDDGQISYLDPLHRTQIQASLSTRNNLSNNAAANIVFAATGRIKDLPLIASGSGGPVLTLNDATTPYPLTIDASLGSTHLHAAGTITSLTQFSAADLDLTLRGASLDKLYPLIGIALPRTAAYSTQGHLLHNGKQWRYDKFVGHIGKSDVTGNFQVDLRGKRPFLEGNLTSQLLDFADLGSLVGMNTPSTLSNSDNSTPTATTKINPTATTTRANKHHVLPKLPFRTNRWNSADADVTIRAKRILRARALPIDNLIARIQMHDSILSLNPLDFGVAGGILAGTISLNGQSDPIHAEAHLHARKLRLNQLFPTIKLTKTSIGQINGDFDLSANGNAVDQMLASANGKMAVVIDSGEISKLMLETIGLHLWEILEVKITGDSLIKLNCAVADFDVHQGVLQTKTMILDTQISTITGTGDINMAQETLHLDLEPHTKIISPLALRSPIYIRGSFAKPVVSLDKTKLVLRSASAVVLGLVNPLLAIIPLVDTGPGENSQCGKLIKKARQPVTLSN